MSILIVTALFGVIYGIYTKISSKSLKNLDLSENVSLSLDQDQKIINIQVIDKGRILITIKHSGDIKGIIYDINNQKIIQTINK